MICVGTAAFFLEIIHRHGVIFSEVDTIGKHMLDSEGVHVRRSESEVVRVRVSESEVIHEVKGGIDIGSDSVRRSPHLTSS